MLSKILTYGAIAGLVAGVTLSALVVLQPGHQPEAYGMLIGYTTMLIALSAIFVAIKRHRDEDGGGVIRFWPAFGLGLGISVVAGIIYVTAWEATIAITHFDFIGGYADSMIQAKRAKGVGGAELAAYVAEMEALKANYANPLFRLPMIFAEIFPVGALVSLVSAGLLRNPRFLPARRHSAAA